MVNSKQRSFVFIGTPFWLPVGKVGASEVYTKMQACAGGTYIIKKHYILIPFRHKLLQRLKDEVRDNVLASIKTFMLEKVKYTSAEARLTLQPKWSRGIIVMRYTWNGEVMYSVEYANQIKDQITKYFYQWKEQEMELKLKMNRDHYIKT